jgi:hypothetical protein
MKEWQHGYDLDYLKSLEAKYSDYNQYTLSPFAKFKKNDIAKSLHDNTLKLLDDSMVDIRICKVPSKISMYQSTYIAEKGKGDLTVSRLHGNMKTILSVLPENKNIWLYVWAEDKDKCAFVESKGFEYVGPKITTYGEIHSIYFRGGTRKQFEVDPAEYASIVKVGDVDKSIIDSIANKLENLPDFTNHYSNYNKGKSWSALSLRGYSPDPSFITKPIEMSKKWQKEHENEKYFLQNTSLYVTFKEDVERLLEPFGDTVHRERFMQLKPGGGELERHTDQVDPDSGGSLGKLARIHFPIVTNPEVMFTVWDYLGNKQKVHMNVGECWFLDTRKAHRAINGGTENRIHLVVDLITENKLYEKILENM